MQHVINALNDLVWSLPKCDNCLTPATKAYKRGEGRWCDKHAPEGCPDYPRAQAVRNALVILSSWKPG